MKLNKISRRETLCAVIGGSVVAGLGGRAAAAAGFDWLQKKGEQVNIGFSAHPMADALIAMIPEFETLTGMKVTYSVTPENDFFTKLTSQLAAGDGSLDVYMCGPATIWQYSTGKWIESLQPYIENPALTSPSWDFSDIFPNAVNVNRWTGQQFGGLGQGPLYAIPMNEEGYSIAYRQDVLEKAGVAVPQTVDELIAASHQLNGYKMEGKTLNGFVGRGQEFWPTLITGYGAILVAYGAKDLNPDGTSAADSPQAIEATRKWIQLLKAGPSDIASYGWQQAQANFAAGNSVFLLDADHMAAVFEDPKQSQVVGKVGYALEPSGPAGRGAGIWLWSLGMNSFSKRKDAAWLFIQWASSKPIMTRTIAFGNINPPRESVANSPQMIKYVSGWGDYNKIWSENLKKYAAWRWNPSTNFTQAGNRWALAVQEAFVTGKDPSVTLKAAAKDINEIIARTRAEG